MPHFIMGEIPGEALTHSADVLVVEDGLQAVYLLEGLLAALDLGEEGTGKDRSGVGDDMDEFDLA